MEESKLKGLVSNHAYSVTGALKVRSFITSELNV